MFLRPFKRYESLMILLFNETNEMLGLVQTPYFSCAEPN